MNVRVTCDLFCGISASLVTTMVASVLGTDPQFIFIKPGQNAAIYDNDILNCL